VKDFATGVRDKAVDAKDAVKDFAQGVKEKASDYFEGAKRNVRDVKEGVKRKGRDLGNRIEGDRSNLYNRPYYRDYHSYGRNRDFDRDRSPSSFFGGDRSSLDRNYDTGYSDLWGNDWSRRDWENRDRSFLSKPYFGLMDRDWDNRDSDRSFWDKPYFGIQNFDPWNMFSRGYDYLSGDHISNAFSISKYIKSDFLPFVNIVELENEFIIFVDVPGMKKSDIKLRLEKYNLIIEGERTMKYEDKDFHINEIRTGKFIRSFSLPDGVNIDGLKSRLENGLLEIRIPRGEPNQVKHNYLNIE